MTAAERRKLTDVARGALPADLVIRGGTLLNVYTGELYPATVAVKGERIAYVGGREDMVGPRTTALAHPRAVAIGEVTRWAVAWSGSRDLVRRLAQAPPRLPRVEGHTAGASGEKLAAIAAAGFTSDHEPITAREVLERARQGIAV